MSDEPKANGAKAFAGIASLCALGGVIGMLFAPMAQRIISLETRAEVNGGKNEENRNRIVAIEERLREVETQFRHQDRLTTLLWHRAYSEELPALKIGGSNGIPAP